MLFRFKCQIGGRCREDRCYGSRGVTTGSAYFRSIAPRYYQIADSTASGKISAINGAATD
ncbi:MAG TPA: hypothetical protein DEP53_16830 [Bacteroidetes bacterium]|nr:hypothetical protein [Bacteroidota bacterium]